MKQNTSQYDQHSPGALSALYGDLSLGIRLGFELHGNQSEVFSFTTDMLHHIQILAPNNNERIGTQAYIAAQQINCGLSVVLFGSGEVTRKALEQIDHDRLSSITFIDLPTLLNSSTEATLGDMTAALLNQVFDPKSSSLAAKDSRVKRKSLLINIDRDALDSHKADSVMQAIFGQSKRVIMRRDITKDPHTPCILHLDNDCLRFSSSLLIWLLNEASRYNVGFVFAHKSLGELASFCDDCGSSEYDVLGSLFANGSLIAFRPLVKDIRLLEAELEVSAYKLRGMPPFCAIVRMVLNESISKPTVVAFPKPVTHYDAENLQYAKKNMRLPEIEHCSGQTGTSWSQLSQNLKEMQLSKERAELLALLDALIKQKEEDND